MCRDANIIFGAQAAFKPSRLRETCGQNVIRQLEEAVKDNEITDC